MAVKFTKPEVNVREKLVELDKPSGIAGEAMLRAETPQEQQALIGVGRKNFIINGNMSVWQRGTSFTGADADQEYTADRWNPSFFDNVNTRSISRSTTAPPGFSFSMEVSGTADITYIATGVELVPIGNAGPFQGWFTFSFYTDLDPTLIPQMYALFRDEVHGTNDVSVILGKEMSVIESEAGNGFRRYAITFYIAATPAGTNECLTIAPEFSSVLGTSFRVTGFQLEKGKVATPFEHRSYGEELALCQRYYLRIGGADNGATTNLIFGGVEASTYGAVGGLAFPTTMRTIPTVSQSGTAFYSAGSGVLSYSIGANRCSKEIGSFIVQGMTGLTPGQVATVYKSSSSGYLEFSAEI